MDGFIPRTILYLFFPLENSTSTKQFLLLTELRSCGFVIDLCGLPNKPNDIASSIVDLPAPLCPTMRVDFVLFNWISVVLLPVERKFFHRTISNIIIGFREPVLLSLIHAFSSLSRLSLSQYQHYQYMH